MRKKAVMTLVPLFVVGALLSLVLAGCGAASGPGGEVGRTRCISYQKKLNAAINVYMMDNDGKPPASINVLLGRYVDAMPICPADGNYVISGNPPKATCTKHGQLQEALTPGDLPQ